MYDRGVSTSGGAAHCLLLVGDTCRGDRSSSPGPAPSLLLDTECTMVHNGGSGTNHQEETGMHERHESAAMAKAARALDAIEVLVAMMIGNLGHPVNDRLEGLRHINNVLFAGHGYIKADIAEMWAQIGLAAGHLEGVSIRSAADVDRLPTYRTSVPFIAEGLDARIALVATHGADVFEELF